MLKFNRVLEVIVPNHKNHGVALSPLERARIEKKIDDLTSSIGGVTWYDTNGRWMDGEGTIYDDSHRTYQWYIEGTDDLQKRDAILERFDSLLSTIFRESAQLSITVKFNNDVYIVDRVSMRLLVELDQFIRVTKFVKEVE